MAAESAEMITVFRKEIKYVIPIELFARLQPRLEQVLEPDAHGSGGSYPVRSQYYDSLTDADLWDNLDGVMEKRKIRLRIYSPQDQMAKLEYKCKSGADGVKHSLSVSREEALLMEQHQYTFLCEREEKLAAMLYTKMTGQVYRPKTIIEYQRSAYTFPVNDVRVTFDTQLRGSVNPYGLFQEKLFYVPLMHEDRGVLEIKYNHFLPDVVKTLVQQIDDLAQASSKYSQARLAFI